MEIKDISAFNNWKNKYIFQKKKEAIAFVVLDIFVILMMFANNNSDSNIFAKIIVTLFALSSMYFSFKTLIKGPKINVNNYFSETIVDKYRGGELGSFFYVVTIKDNTRIVAECFGDEYYSLNIGDNCLFFDLNLNDYYCTKL